jgi:hypothetical protein
LISPCSGLSETQQRSVGHAEAIALRRDRGAFHVDADRARQAEPPCGLGVAQFPVAIIGRDDRARAHTLLEVRAAGATDHLRRLRQRSLNLGDGGIGISGGNTGSST